MLEIRARLPLFRCRSVVFFFFFCFIKRATWRNVLSNGTEGRRAPRVANSLPIAMMEEEKSERSWVVRVARKKI